MTLDVLPGSAPKAVLLILHPLCLGVFERRAWSLPDQSLASHPAVVGFPAVPQKSIAPSHSDGKSIPVSTQCLPRLVLYPSTATSRCSGCSICIPPRPDMTHRRGLARGPHPGTRECRRRGHSAAQCPLCTHKSPAAHSPASCQDLAHSA